MPTWLVLSMLPIAFAACSGRNEDECMATMTCGWCANGTEANACVAWTACDGNQTDTCSEVRSDYTCDQLQTIQCGFITFLCVLPSACSICLACGFRDDLDRVKAAIATSWLLLFVASMAVVGVYPSSPSCPHRWILAAMNYGYILLPGT